jgi:hypothetical protein
VYAITSKTIDQFYQSDDTDQNTKFTGPEVIGYHWFGGHVKSQNFENDLQPDTVNDYTHFLARTIQEQL